MSETERRLRATIRELLNRNQISDAALARAVDHKPAWSSMFLNGKRSMRLKDLDAVAKLLGVDVSRLLREDDATPLTPSGSDVVENAAPLKQHVGVQSNEFAPQARIRELETEIERLRTTLKGLRVLTGQAEREIARALDRERRAPARKRKAGVRGDGRGHHPRSTR